MKYDDASWHYGGDFPDDLPQSAGGTHSGMFLARASLNDMTGSLHTDDFPDALARPKAREITPGQYLLTVCNEKFTDGGLNEEGNAFAAAYFDLESGQHLADYAIALCGDLPTLYHAADTWEPYDQLAPVLDLALLRWRSKSERRWWEIWEN